MTALTIAAVATPPGISGVAVIRISGPQAAEVLRRLTGRLPPPRAATLSTLRDPATGSPLDQGLVLWFPAPASFTGEDCAEFQIHGGRAVVAAVLGAVVALEGVRPAEPGEFTRRAFENGKLDLAAIEGLGDLLHAETEAQRRQAYALYQGRLTDETDRLAQQLLPVLALVEATIDFPDEGDVTDAALMQARSQALAVRDRIAGLLADAGRAERMRDGVVVAIAGPPNAGKSTLLNAMARRDVAIVSPIAGTTRDALEVQLDLGGLPVVLVDTAGIRETQDPVEAEGVRRARRRVSEADLVLWLTLTIESAAERPEGSWMVQSQADRAVEHIDEARHRISAATGAGLAALLADVQSFASSLLGGEPAVVVHQRHRRIMAEALASMEAALGHTDWSASAELVAEDFRAALAALGRSRGRVGTEAMLDQLFSAFCIGK
jgi:tRNA modification GTPase